MALKGNLKDSLIEHFQKITKIQPLEDYQVDKIIDLYFERSTLQVKAQNVGMKQTEWLVWLHLNPEVRSFLIGLRDSSIDLLEDEIHSLCQTSDEDILYDTLGNPVLNKVKVTRDKMKVDYLIKKIDRLSKKTEEDSTLTITVRELS